MTDRSDLRASGRSEPRSDRLARALFADSQYRSLRDLVAGGLSSTTIYRLVERGILMKAPGKRGFFLVDLPECPWEPIAARFGGEQNRPHGVLCLAAAAVIHDLTDLTFANLGEAPVAVPYTANTRTLGLGVEVIRWRNQRSFAADELEWRIFGGAGIHVTDPSRTVADLFGPKARLRGDGCLAVPAMAALVVRDPRAASRAVAIASELGWGGTVSTAFEAAMAARVSVSSEGGFRP